MAADDPSLSPSLRAKSMISPLPPRLAANALHARNYTSRRALRGAAMLSTMARSSESKTTTFPARVVVVLRRWRHADSILCVRA